MINKVILVGNVGSDPEVKRFDNNQMVANFSLATQESYTDKQGNKQTLTEWHKVVIWGKLAEVVEKYVKKGNQLYIEGKIRTRSYDDSNGVKKYATEIVADTMKMLGSKNTPQADSAPAASHQQSQVDEMQSDETDLPF